MCVAAVGKERRELRLRRRQSRKFLCLLLGERIVAKAAADFARCKDMQIDIHLINLCLLERLNLLFGRPDKLHTVYIKVVMQQDVHDLLEIIHERALPFALTCRLRSLGGRSVRLLDECRRRQVERIRDDARKPLVELILHRRIFWEDRIHARRNESCLALYIGVLLEYEIPVFLELADLVNCPIGRTGEECLGNCPLCVVVQLIHLPIERKVDGHDDLFHLAQPVEFM